MTTLPPLPSAVVEVGESFGPFMKRKLYKAVRAYAQQVAAAKDQEIAEWKQAARAEAEQVNKLTAERDALRARVTEVVRQMDTDERGKPYVYTKPSMVIWTEKWRGWVAMLREALPAAPQHEGEK